MRRKACSSQQYQLLRKIMALACCLDSAQQKKTLYIWQIKKNIQYSQTILLNKYKMIQNVQVTRSCSPAGTHRSLKDLLPTDCSSWGWPRSHQRQHPQKSVNSKYNGKSIPTKKNKHFSRNSQNFDQMQSKSSQLSHQPCCHAWCTMKTSCAVDEDETCRTVQDREQSVGNSVVL